MAENFQETRTLGLVRFASPLAPLALWASHRVRPLGGLDQGFFSSSPCSASAPLPPTLPASHFVSLTEDGPAARARGRRRAASPLPTGPQQPGGCAEGVGAEGSQGSTSDIPS